MKKTAMLFLIVFIFVLTGCSNSVSNSPDEIPAELLGIDEKTYVKTLSSLCDVKMELEEKSPYNDDTTLYYYVNSSEPTRIKLTIIQNDDSSLIENLNVKFSKNSFDPQDFCNVLLAINDSAFDQVKAYEIYDKLLNEQADNPSLNFGIVETDGYSISIDDFDDDVWFWIEKSEKKAKHNSFDEIKLDDEVKFNNDSNSAKLDLFEISCKAFIYNFTFLSGINMNELYKSDGDKTTNYGYADVVGDTNLSFNILEDTETEKIHTLNIVFMKHFVPEAFSAALKVIDNSIDTDDDAHKIYNELKNSQKDDSSGFGFLDSNEFSYMIHNSENGALWITVTKKN